MVNLLPLEGSFLAYYALALLYFLLCIVAAVRLWKIYVFRGGWDVTKSFALLVFLHNFIRALTLGAMCIFWQPTEREVSQGSRYPVLYILIQIPDSVFLTTYCFLILQYIRSYSQAHLPIGGLSLTYSLMDGREKSQGLNNFMAGLFNMGLYASQLAIFVLYFREDISDAVNLVVLGITNIILVGVVAFISGVLFFRYSGYPFRSAASHEKVRKLTWVMAMWTAGRMVRGILGLLAATENPSINNPDTDLMFFMVIIALYLVAEVFPFLLVLDWSFVGLLLFSEEENASSGARVSASPVSALAWRVTPQDLQTFDEIGSRVDGMGVVYRGELKGKPAAIKVLKFQKLSKYVVEELAAELDALSTYQHESILPLLGACLDVPVIALITPYLPNRSLYDILHSEDCNLSWGKLQIMAQQVASAFVYLNAQNPPVVHGHLTTKNLLVGDNMNNVLIADLGLERLKKYAGVVCGYSNKSAWTAPELLADRCRTVANASPAADVYSFGIILWEMYTRTVPFDGMTLLQIKKFVVDGDYRPSIPPQTPAKLAELIRLCWQSLPESRPSFVEVLGKLNSL
eukprot:GILJ01003710.1.p1 GENE.GILJ01003710.1~~GILJ01003710.1.p1  ORF type:complete len:573 (+),score=49.04 GILJ01003710.1:67-1785(+)